MNEKSPEEIQVPESEENNEISICLLLSEEWEKLVYLIHEKDRVFIQEFSIYSRKQDKWE